MGHGMLVRGLCLAAAAALPAWSQELPLPAPASEESAAPISATSMGFTSYRAECERPGAVDRWFRRWVARNQHSHWGYPREFEDAPLGLMVHSHIATGVANGHAARMALHQYDFYAGSDQLTPRGRYQVAKMSEWLPMNQFPVFVEPSAASAALDEARRQAVWSEIAGGPCRIPLERVLIGYTTSRGLGGIEAQAIDLNRLKQTSSRGMGAVGGGADAGSGGGAATTEDSGAQEF